MRVCATPSVLVNRDGPGPQCAYRSMSSAVWQDGKGDTGQMGDSDGEGGPGDSLACALEMEASGRGARGQSKLDRLARDGLTSGNGGDSAQVSVPLSLTGKRTTPMEGENLYRLRDRKVLLEDKKRLCALALGTALLGILLMIIHAEICPFVYKPVGLNPIHVFASEREAQIPLLISNK